MIIPKKYNFIRYSIHFFTKSLFAMSLDTNENPIPGAPAILEKELEPFFLNTLPPLPVNLKEGLVKYWPWVLLVLLILTSVMLLTVLGMASSLNASLNASGMPVGTFYYVWLLVAIGSVVLSILGLMGLFKKSRQGWVFIYYAQWLTVLSHILNFDVLGILLSFLWIYFLYQIRSYYTN